MRISSNLEAFFTALRTSIIGTGTIWTDATCNLSLWDEFAQITSGTPLLFIIPQTIGVWGDAQDGGGIATTVLEGEIKFRIVVHNILDSVFSDQNAITSTSDTLGIYKLVDDLIGICQMWDNCNSSHNSYLIEPMRLQSVGKADRDHTHPEYVCIDVVFDFRLKQFVR